MGCITARAEAPVLPHVLLPPIFIRSAIKYWKAEEGPPWQRKATADQMTLLTGKLRLRYHPCDPAVITGCGYSKAE